MPTGEVNRAKWADVVRRLMDRHAKGRKATFAKLVGVDPRTVTDWLGGVYKVRDSMVRQVADRTGESALELLIEVGVLPESQRAGVSGVPAEDQWIVDTIEASSLTPAQKAAMIAVQLEQAHRERMEQARRIREQISLIQPESRSSI